MNSQRQMSDWKLHGSKNQWQVSPHSSSFSPFRAKLCLYAFYSHCGFICHHYFGNPPPPPYLASPALELLVAGFLDWNVVVGGGKVSVCICMAEHESAKILS